jgi:hypothetical protein
VSTPYVTAPSSPVVQLAKELAEDMNIDSPATDGNSGAGSQPAATAETAAAAVLEAELAAHTAKASEIQRQLAAIKAGKQERLMAAISALPDDLKEFYLQQQAEFKQQQVGASPTVTTSVQGAPTAGVTGAPKPPPPPPAWTGAKDKDSKLPRGKIWLALIVAYCTLLKYEFVSHFMYFLQGAALEWFYALNSAYRAMGKELTKEAIQEEFLKTYDPTVRSERRVARNKIFDGECTMAQYDTVQKYSAEFLTLCRRAVDLSVTDQVLWFIRGLSSQIKQMCAVQTDGKEWTDLSALIDFAYGCEQRLAAGAAVNKATKSLNYVQTTSNTKHHHGHTQAQKQRRNTNDGAGPSQVKKQRTTFTRILDMPRALRDVWKYHAKKLTEGAFVHHVNNSKCVACHKVGHTWAECRNK